MAGEAGHGVVAMRAVFRRDSFAPRQAAVVSDPSHQFGPRCTRIEMDVAALHRVTDQADFPFQIGIGNRPLDQHPLSVAFHPFEAALTIGVAQQRQIGAARRSRRAGGQQRRQRIGGAMAILAADLDGIGHLAIDEAIAMAVLREMAVGALQTLFGMDVHHMHGATGVGAGFDELGLALPPPAFGIVGRDDISGVGAIGRHIAFGVEQIALAVALQHRAEIPAMAMIIGELRIAQLAVEAVDIAQEFDIAPQPARGSSLGIAVVNFAHFARRRIMLRPIDALIILVAHPRRTRRDILRPRPHRRRVGFIIPHRVTEVAVQEDVRLMHMAIHALRGRYRAGEGVADRMAALAPFGATRRDERAMARATCMCLVAWCHRCDLLR